MQCNLRCTQQCRLQLLDLLVPSNKKVLTANCKTILKAGARLQTRKFLPCLDAPTNPLPSEPMCFRWFGFTGFCVSTARAVNVGFDKQDLWAHWVPGTNLVSFSYSQLSPRNVKHSLVSRVVNLQRQNPSRSPHHSAVLLRRLMFPRLFRGRNSLAGRCVELTMCCS